MYQHKTCHTRGQQQQQLSSVLLSLHIDRPAILSQSWIPPPELEIYSGIAVHNIFFDNLVYLNKVSITVWILVTCTSCHINVTMDDIKQRWKINTLILMKVVHYAVHKAPVLTTELQYFVSMQQQSPKAGLWQMHQQLMAVAAVAATTAVAGVRERLAIIRVVCKGIIADCPWTPRLIPANHFYSHDWPLSLSTQYLLGWPPRCFPSCHGDMNAILMPWYSMLQ